MKKLFFVCCALIATVGCKKEAGAALKEETAAAATAGHGTLRCQIQYSSQDYRVRSLQGSGRVETAFDVVTDVNRPDLATSTVVEDDNMKLEGTLQQNISMATPGLPAPTTIKRLAVNVTLKASGQKLNFPYMLSSANGQLPSLFNMSIEGGFTAEIDGTDGHSNVRFVPYYANLECNPVQLP